MCAKSFKILLANPVVVNFPILCPLKTPENLWFLLFSVGVRSGVFIVNFEHIPQLVLMYNLKVNAGWVTYMKWVPGTKNFCGIF